MTRPSRSPGAAVSAASLTPALVLGGSVIAGPLLGAGLVARSQRQRERRERTVALLESFLAEPMAGTRRAAWAFLHAEGDAVRHFSHYVLTDPEYGDPAHQQGVVALLKVALFHRTVQDLRAAGALDRQLYRELLEPHRQAWTGYTERIAARSASDPEAISRGDAGLFSWRDG
ncbi:MAG: hypothetical protein ACLFUG_00200 [Nitriliruptoraceae bacterium]